MKGYVADLAAMVGGNATASQNHSGTLRRPKVGGHARHLQKKALTVVKRAIQETSYSRH